MTIRSISAIAEIFAFVGCANIITIVRSKMNRPVIVVGSLQSHAVVVYLDRGDIVLALVQRISGFRKYLR